MFAKCRKKIGRNKLTFTLCICSTFFGCILFTHVEFSQLVGFKFQYESSKSESQISNYFLQSEEIRDMGFLIDTELCKILNFDPFHKSSLTFIKPVERVNCAKKYGRLTFTNQTNLVLNETAVKNMGYSIDSISCCYSVISRVEQTIQNYDMDADSRYSLSECNPLKSKITRMTAEFIKISCFKKYFYLFDDLVYKNYHTFPQLLKNEAVRRKINFWKKHKHAQESETDAHENKTVRKRGQRQENPPNILVLGIDSVSRLNFHRNLQKTVNYLKEIGSIEMVGYTKVGDNTFPNTVPLMSGYSVSDLEEICWESPEMPFDSCPFLWKKFSSGNYLTGHLEDSPIMAIFNFLKTGFVQQPVDFYLRPFMLPLYEEKNFIQFGSFQKYTKHCVASDPPHQKIFGYFENLLKMSQEENTPIFLYSWATGLSHDNMNALKNADDYFENFLKRMDLNNSILFVMSDHGFRFGEFRQTPSGWFEDKLPWLSIYLPPEIKRDYPKWLDALQINSKRLLSPYDMYHTWSHLLEEFTDVSPFPEVTLNKSGKVYTLPRKFGQSIFKIPPESDSQNQNQSQSRDRSCADAGILQSFCACSTPIAISLESPELKKAAEFLVNSINKKVPAQCSQFRLNKITNGAILTGDSIENLMTNKTEKSHLENNLISKNYIVGLVVTPGHFSFEATVSFSPIKINTENNQSGKKEESFKILGDILRTSKYTRDVSCVSESRMQGFCYCL